MITLEEAIRHCEETADENEVCMNGRAIANEDDFMAQMCADEHRQLAEWLKDYKRLRESRLHDLYIRDKEIGDIKRIWDNLHDMLTIMNDKLYYLNLQNNDGCVFGESGGGCEFVENADSMGYNYDPREGD